MDIKVDKGDIWSKLIVSVIFYIRNGTPTFCLKRRCYRLFCAWRVIIIVNMLLLMAIGKVMIVMMMAMTTMMIVMMMAMMFGSATRLKCCWAWEARHQLLVSIVNINFVERKKYTRCLARRSNEPSKSEEKLFLDSQLPTTTKGASIIRKAEEVH